MYQDAPVQSPQRTGDSEIGQRLAYCRGELTQLHEVISGLEARLEEVLRPPGPTTAENQSSEKSPGPPRLERKLRDIGDHVGHASHRLRDLLDRLEV